MIRNPKFEVLNSKFRTTFENPRIAGQYRNPNFIDDLIILDLKHLNLLSISVLGFRISKELSDET